MKKNVRAVVIFGILIALALLACGSAAADMDYPKDPDYTGMVEILQRKQEWAEEQVSGVRRRDGKALNVAISGSKSGIITGVANGEPIGEENSGVPCEELTFTATLTGEQDLDGIEYKWVIQDQNRDGNGVTYHPKTENLTGNTTEHYYFYSAGTYMIYVEAWQDETLIIAGGAYFGITNDGLHPTIEDKVAEIVEANRGSSDWETALNLHDWLTHNSYYDYSYARHGADMVFTGFGVCDSYSKDYLLLLTEAGITAERVIGNGHAWNAVQLNGEWYHVDPTWDDPGSATIPVSGRENHDYFCINDELIFGIMDQQESHQESTKTGCSSLDASWPMHTGDWRNYGRYFEDEEEKDYRDLILNGIDGENRINVAGNADYLSADGWRMEWSDYSKQEIARLRYFFAYGLSRTGIEVAVENGSHVVELSLSYNFDNYYFVGIKTGESAIAEDSGIVLRLDGNRLADGDAVGGKIQYKFYAENLPEGCDALQFGWSENMSAVQPDEWEDDPRGLQSDAAGQFFYVLPELEGNYNSEMMFVRVNAQDEHPCRIAVYYDRIPRETEPIPFTNERPPVYGQTDYELAWEDVLYNDAYFVCWRTPDDVYMFGPEDLSGSSMSLSEKGFLTEQFGSYMVTVFSVSGNRIYRKSEPWMFTIVSDPVLEADPENAETVIIASNGSVSAPMHQRVSFRVSAPDSDGVDIFWLDEVPGDLTEEQSLNSQISNGFLHDYEKLTSFTSEDGWTGFSWTPNDLPEDWSGGNYIKYVVAEVRYEGGTYKRVSVQVTVEVSTTVNGTVEYAIPGGTVIPLDGELIIEINNAMNDADFYGAYILKNEDDYGDPTKSSSHYWDWLEDSRWTTKENDKASTQVRLPVLRCEVGDNYCVHVYAVKFGAPQLESSEVPIILVTDAETDSPVILSMKNSYNTGERLMLHACYLNPAPEQDGWMNVQIWEADDPENIVYESSGDWDDFYDVDAVIREPGTYNAVAKAVTIAGNGGEITLASSPVKTFTVSYQGTAVPQLTVELDPSETEGIDNEIPVHTDFTVHINAYGATGAVLDMGGGYDQGPIRLDEFEEWWNGEWGENHDKICLDVWYDESCENKDTDCFRMQVKAEYKEPNGDVKTVRSTVTKVFCTTEGLIDVSNWKPVLWYAINQEGNVFFSSEQKNTEWQQYPAEGITIERGKCLMILDLWKSTHQEGGNEGSTFFGALLGRDGQGNADWTYGMYDRNITGGEDGWLTLSTARYVSTESATVDGSLWLLTWKEGYDSGSVTYPITITGTKSEDEQVFWNFSEIDDKWTYDPIDFSVYVPGAEHMEVVILNGEGKEVFHDGCGEDLYAFMGWEGETEAALTFMAFGEYHEEVNGKKSFEFTYPHTVTIQSNGLFPAPSVTLIGAENGIVEEGQEIRFTFTENEKLEAFIGSIGVEKNTTYSACLLDEYGEDVREPMREISPGETLVFDTDGLEPGHVYQLCVDVRQPHYSRNAAEAWILLLPENAGQDPEVTLTAEGLAPDGTVPVNREVVFRLAAEDGEVIEEAALFNGDDWRDFDHFDPEDLWETVDSFTDDRVYPIYARVHLQGRQEPVLTNMIQVTGIKEGNVEPFTFETDMTTDEDGNYRVTRGDVITVTYESAENATHYWLDIEEYNDEDRVWHWTDHQADLVLDGTEECTAMLFTAELEEGKRYRMFAVADSEGYIRAETESVEFSVTEPENGGIVMRVVAGEDLTIQTGGEILVSVYAPGADWIEMLYNAGDEDELIESYDGSGFNDMVQPYWITGSYNIVARAWRPVTDENGDPVQETDEGGNPRYDEEGREIWERTSEDSEAVKVTVKADGGTVALTGSDGLPAYLAIGEDMSVNAYAPQSGMDWIKLFVDVCEEDGSIRREPLLYRETEGEPISANIVWNDRNGIHAGQELIVRAEGGKHGFTVRGWERRIPVLEQPDPEENGAILRFEDDLPGENNTVALDQPLKAVLIPQNGKRLAAVRFFDGQNFWNNGDPITPYDEWENFRKEDDAFVTSFRIEDRDCIGSRVIYAYYMLEGENEWIISNLLTVNVVSLGMVGDFDFTEEQPKELAPVTQGDLVVLQIEPAECATEYWIEAEDTHDRQSWHYAECMVDGTTMMMSTAGLPAGEYRLWARAGREGFIWSGSESSVKLTVTELGEGEINLSLSKDIVPDDEGNPKATVLTMEEIAWSVYAPGATAISIVTGYYFRVDETTYISSLYPVASTGDSDDPEYLAGRYNFGECVQPMAFILATAAYDSGETREKKIGIDVIAPEGNLNRATILGSRWCAGKALDFTVIPDERAEGYQIGVYIVDTESGDSETFYATEMGTFETGTMLINIPANMLDGKVRVEVSVTQFAKGYNDCTEKYYRIRAIEGEGVFTLPAGLISIGKEAFAEDMEITHLVIPDKVTSIGERAFENCMNLHTIEIPRSVTTIEKDVFVPFNVTIYGYGGSYAETYAKRNSVDFVCID